MLKRIELEGAAGFAGKLNRCRNFLLLGAACAGAWMTLLTPTVLAQTPAAHAFEVVSIRPDKSGDRIRNAETTPDGFRTIGQSIWTVIMMAYSPSGLNGQLQGAPSWISDPYNIDARVSQADMPQWQKQGVTLDKQPMLREMLQSMLADRCKLTFHRIPGSITGFALDVNRGRRGAHLTLSKAGATLPSGMKYPDGGVAVGNHRGEPVRWRFYNASLADLAQHLTYSSMAQPVVDRTGLTGRYDFVLSGISNLEYPERGLAPGLDGWDLDSLGLHVVSIKIPIDTLVIDHIEKPTEN